MKKIFLLLCLPLLLLAEDATIRMMSWNIWGNAQKVPAEREQPIIDVVKRYSPDIILLQEDQLTPFPKYYRIGIPDQCGHPCGDPFRDLFQFLQKFHCIRTAGRFHKTAGWN